MNSPTGLRSLGSGAATLLLVGTLTGCTTSAMLPSSAGSANQAGGAGTPQAQAIAHSDLYATWRKALMRTTLPAAGCFHAAYPSYAWARVACSTPPHFLYPLPASGSVHSEVGSKDVGNGNDYTADTSPNTISNAIGSFPVVTGVTSVKSVTNPSFGCCGENGKNSYTLQLNSYFFTTSACGNIANCAGWEQFVYENPPGTHRGELFIQDWLVPTGSGGLSGCPAGKGWERADGGCVQNSPDAVNVPNVAVKDLADLTETGEAASSGDSIYLAVSSDVYGMKNVQSDGITDLSAHWQGAEFNIIGNAGGDIAKFNSGSTIEVSLQADTGVLSAPTCPADSGTTGESNNLSFVAAPSNPPELEYPSILFTESNAHGGGSASCDALAGSGV